MQAISDQLAYISMHHMWFYMISLWKEEITYPAEQMKRNTTLKDLIWSEM